MIRRTSTPLSLPMSTSSINSSSSNNNSNYTASLYARLLFRDHRLFSILRVDVVSTQGRIGSAVKKLVAHDAKSGTKTTAPNNVRERSATWSEQSPAPARDVDDTNNDDDGSVDSALPARKKRASDEMATTTTTATTTMTTTNEAAPSSKRAKRAAQHVRYRFDVVFKF